MLFKTTWFCRKFSAVPFRCSLLNWPTICNRLGMSVNAFHWFLFLLFYSFREKYCANFLFVLYIGIDFPLQNDLNKHKAAIVSTYFYVCRCRCMQRWQTDKHKNAEEWSTAYYMNSWMVFSLWSIWTYDQYWRIFDSSTTLRHLSTLLWTQDMQCVRKSIHRQAVPHFLLKIFHENTLFTSNVI